MAKKTVPQKQPAPRPEAKKARPPPLKTAPWGRAAGEYRPGLFIKRYLAEHGRGCAAEIYYGLSQELDRINANRATAGERPIRRPNYSSFARYFHWFKKLRLVEKTGRKEPAMYDFLQAKVFFRLTPTGMAEVRLRIVLGKGQ